MSSIETCNCGVELYVCDIVETNLTEEAGEVSVLRCPSCFNLVDSP